MKINLGTLTLALLIALANSAQTAHAAKTEWVMADFAEDSGLSSLLGGADAILTVKKTVENSQSVRPMIRIFKDGNLAKPKDEKTATLKEWARANTPAGKNGKGVILNERALGENKYVIEFRTATADKDTDMHSFLMVMKVGNKHYLFVFDGLSTALAPTLPLVKDLYGKMNAEMLKDFFAHAVKGKKS